uniref:Uncharacterized protein n=1 Tax=Setaria viridis TaxID=4556 RepID=A0A4V6DAR0_SETVI|nr:hypothetical protein SEVIR_2G031600v2 [Setaria viridis]
MERWLAHAASASCRRQSRCWWPHAGVWCGHEPRRPEPQAAATTRVEALRPADPWAAPVRDSKLLPLLMQLVRGWQGCRG